MPIINVLDPSTISKIAAGEVVERPLSVVKELIENSIDAGATEINVTLEDGGHRLIRVSDNGRGMSREDVSLCLKSHTTSKLAAVEDLENIITMGFRGEALHSIGAVARLKLTTCDGTEDVGWEVRMEGGVETEAEPAARVRGTTVEVENLFYNVPARRKFMGTPRSEISAINNMFMKYIVGHPSIGFELVHNGRSMQNVKPNEDVRQRIEYMMGASISKELVHATNSLRGIGLNVFFSLPDLTFTNRKYQMFFVNGRAVKDKHMTVAVDTSYRGLVPAGRFGMAVIFLDVPSQLVDTNVHPTKTEVRFANSHDIHSVIYRTLRGRFVQPDPAEAESSSGNPFRLISNQKPGGSAAQEKEPDGLMDRMGVQRKHAPVQSEFVMPRAEESEEERSSAPAAHIDADISDDPTLDADAPFRDLDEKAPQDNAPEDSEDSDDDAPEPQRFEVLGQFFDTFIMIQMDGSPVFVDQHVASERVIYNRLRRKSIDRHAQMLLLSEPVDVPRDVFETLSDNLELVKKIGLEIEPFGDRSFVIRSVVHNSGPFDPASLLVSVADEIKSSALRDAEDLMLDRLLTVASCKMAVKAGQKLTNEEMRGLVLDLLKEEYNRTCPHGRPIFYSISQEMLNTWFRR